MKSKKKLKPAISSKSKKIMWMDVSKENQERILGRLKGFMKPEKLREIQNIAITECSHCFCDCDCVCQCDCDCACECDCWCTETV